MNKQQMNELKQVVLRTFVRSLFDSSEQVQRLRDAFPEAVDGEIYDLVEQCTVGGVAVPHDHRESVPVLGSEPTLRSSLGGSLNRFRQLVSAWHSAPARAKRVEWPSREQVPMLFGSIWTVQPDASMVERDWGIVERLPMVVLAETVDEDSTSPAGGVVQIFPLSIWPEFATDADLIVNGSLLPQPMMVEVWNEQPLLCSLLFRCLGALSEQDMERLVDLAVAVRTGDRQSAKAVAEDHYCGSPLGGDHDPRRLFQQIELLRTLPLRVPALAALRALASSANASGKQSQRPDSFMDFATMLELHGAPAMAAASTDPERSLPTVRLCCDSPVVEMDVSESVSGNFLAIEVLRDDTHALVGATVVDDKGAELGTFSSEGSLRIQMHRGTMLAVRLASGDTLRFRKVENCPVSITWRDIRRCRSLRRLLDPECLVTLLRSPCADSELRQQVAAELAVRAWLLSGGGEGANPSMQSCLEEGLQALGLDAQEIAAASTWCGHQTEQRSFLPPSSLSSAGSLLWRMVAYDLENWRTAHGYVLLVPKHGAAMHGFSRGGVALPFILDDTATARTESVRCADDTPIGDSTTNCAVRSAHVVARTCGWLRQGECLAVKLTTLRGPFDNHALTGGSLGLAVLLALALRARDNGQTPVFAFGASGDIGNNGCLVPGTHVGDAFLLKERLLCSMGVSHRLLPTGPEYARDDTIRLPDMATARFLKETVSRVFVRVEGASKAAARTLRDMERCIDNVQRGMRYGSVSAPDAKSKCESVLAELDGSSSVRAADLRLWATANLASAECHLGHPGRSAQFCEQVIGDPSCGPRFKLQALVRQVVNLTDTCRYEDAVRTAQEASSLLGHMGTGTERLDMELQVTGSMGQALCYWALIEPERTEEALRALQRGCELAGQLDGDCPTDTPDLPRSLCYWYLAHALLKPDQAEKVYQDVRDTCLSDPKTREYLLRARWLSAYRMLLLGLELPPSLAGLDMEMPSPTVEGGWLHQTAAKYRGALCAARGDIEGACRDFEVAAKLIEIGDRSPLLEFIGATACLQAGESLAAARPDTARSYLERASTVFDERKGWFAGVICGAEWADRARELLDAHPSTSSKGPQLCYPY